MVAHLFCERVARPVADTLPPGQRGSLAVTLIELPVVIAIMAILIALLLPGLGPTTAWAGPSAVANGSFEQCDVSGRPVGWQCIGAARIVAGAGRDGGRAVEIRTRHDEPLGSVHSAPFELALPGPYRRLTGSYWSKSVRDQGKCSVSCAVYWLDAEGQRFKRNTRTHINPTDDRGSWDWRRTSFAVRVPRQAAYASVVLGTFKGPCRVWFDTFHIERGGLSHLADAQDLHARQALQRRKRIAHDAVVPGAVVLDCRAPAGLRLPAEQGTPLTRGSLFSTGHARITTESGKAIPAQFRVLERWPDGSIRWVFAVCVPPAHTRRLRLQWDGTPAPEPRTRLRAGGPAGPWTVTTGPLTATFDPAAGRIARLDLDANANGRFEPSERVAGPSNFQTGSAMAMGPPKTIVWEETGPVRAVLRVRGDCGGTEPAPFAYETRYRFYAGLALVRLQHTLIVTGDRPRIVLPRVTWSLDLGASARRILAGDRSGHRLETSAPSARLGVRLVTEGRARFPYRWRAGDSKPVPGEDPDNWLAVRQPRCWLAAALEHFAEMAPKALEMAQSRVQLHLHDPDPANPLRAAVGTARTHHWTLWLGPELPNRSACNALARGVVRFDPDANWFGHTRVFGPVFPVDRTRFPDYERLFAASADQYATEQSMRTTADYGWLQFGDIGTSNLETEWPKAWLLAYVRTGDPKYFRRAMAGTWHYVDVDTNHYALEPEKAKGPVDAPEQPLLGVPVGRVFVHQPGHRLLGQGSASHTWYLGVLDAYRLTGQRRLLEVARRAGDWLVDKQLPEYQYSRELGQPLHVMSELYSLTQDPRHLARAMDIWHWLKRNSHYITRFKASKRHNPFATTIPGDMADIGVAQALRAYAQITELPEARELFLTLERELLNQARYRPGDTHVLAYFRDWLDNRSYRMIDSLVYAYLWSGQRRFLDAAIANQYVAMQSIGPDCTLLYCTSALFAVMREQGMSRPETPVPRRPLVQAKTWHIHKPATKPVCLVLFQRPVWRTRHSFVPACVRIHAPDGKTVVTQRLDKWGVNHTNLTLPASCAPGRYTLKVMMDPTLAWSWNVAQITGPQVSIPVFDLVPGKHTLKVRIGKRGSVLDYWVLTKDHPITHRTSTAGLRQVMAAWQWLQAGPRPSDATVIREAEAGAVSGKVHVKSDANASGGKYIGAGQAFAGSVAYEFRVSKAGRYYWYGRVFFPDYTSNYLEVSVDGATSQVVYLQHERDRTLNTTWSLESDDARTEPAAQADAVNIRPNPLAAAVTFHGAQARLLGPGVKEWTDRAYIVAHLPDPLSGLPSVPFSHSAAKRMPVPLTFTLEEPAVLFVAFGAKPGITFARVPADFTRCPNGAASFVSSGGNPMAIHFKRYAPGKHTFSVPKGSYVIVGFAKAAILTRLGVHD